MDLYYTKNFETCLNYAINLRDNKGLKYFGTELLLYGVLCSTDGEGFKLLADFGCNKERYSYYLRKSFRKDNINN